MRLIGKLDSPYVRRVAVSLHTLGLPFVHDALSVFSDFDAFSAVNPVVKAPTLITDDGVVLMDSTLILATVEHALPPAQRLCPADPGLFTRHQRVVGLALAACEKTVQIVYEHRLRPENKRHQPWLDRVGGQLREAYVALNDACTPTGAWLFGPRMLQADITAAIAWDFTATMLPGVVLPERHPHLVALSTAAEATTAFRAFAPA